MLAWTQGPESLTQPQWLQPGNKERQRVGATLMVVMFGRLISKTQSTAVLQHADEHEGPADTNGYDARASGWGARIVWLPSLIVTTGAVAFAFWGMVPASTGTAVNDTGDAFTHQVTPSRACMGKRAALVIAANRPQKARKHRCNTAAEEGTAEQARRQELHLNSRSLIDRIMSQPRCKPQVRPEASPV